MLTTFCYKLTPSQTQLSLMENWLNMLRALYNFCLRERIEAYEQVKAPVMGSYLVSFLFSFSLMRITIYE